MTAGFGIYRLPSRPHYDGAGNGRSPRAGCNPGFIYAHLTAAISAGLAVGVLQLPVMEDNDHADDVNLLLTILIVGVLSAQSRCPSRRS